jgi:hypothetical protein
MTPAQLAHNPELTQALLTVLRRDQLGHLLDLNTHNLLAGATHTLAHPHTIQDIR